MVWPDGVTFNSDGYMYTGAAQLTLTNRAAGRRRRQEQGALLRSIGFAAGRESPASERLMLQRFARGGPCDALS